MCHVNRNGELVEPCEWQKLAVEAVAKAALTNRKLPDIEEALRLHYHNSWQMTINAESISI